MDPLRLEALGSAILNVPRLPLAVPKPQAVPAETAAVAALGQVQALAQGWNLLQSTVQPALQAAAAGTAVPATTATDPTQSFTSALAAALTPAQATATAASATAAPTDSGTATPIPATAVVAAATETLATTTPAETGASADFALLTALRFGAGVVPLGAPAFTAADLGATLVRDAAAVPRLPSLQPQPGRPGPEDFARLLQAQAPQAVEAYRGAPAPATAAGLDLVG